MKESYKIVPLALQKVVQKETMINDYWENQEDKYLHPDHSTDCPQENQLQFLSHIKTWIQSNWTFKIALLC